MYEYLYEKIEEKPCFKKKIYTYKMFQDFSIRNFRLMVFQSLMT